MLFDGVAQNIERHSGAEIDIAVAALLQRDRGHRGGQRVGIAFRGCAEGRGGVSVVRAQCLADLLDGGVADFGGDVVGRCRAIGRRPHVGEAVEGIGNRAVADAGEAAGAEVIGHDKAASAIGLAMVQGMQQRIIGIVAGDDAEAVGGEVSYA